MTGWSVILYALYGGKIVKKRIIEATKKAIIKRGLQEIKISDVAREAKIGKGTVYLYFKDKQQVFIVLIDSFFDEADEFIKRAKKTKGNGLKKLNKFVELDLNFYEKNRKLFNVLGEDVGSFSKMLDKKRRTTIFKRYFQIIDSIASLIKICKKEGFIGKITAREGTLILLSIIHAYAGQRIHGLSKRALKKEKGKIIQIFLRGVGNV